MQYFTKVPQVEKMSLDKAYSVLYTIPAIVCCQARRLTDVHDTPASNVRWPEFRRTVGCHKSVHSYGA